MDRKKITGLKHGRKKMETVEKNIKGLHTGN